MAIESRPGKPGGLARRGLVAGIAALGAAALAKLSAPDKAQAGHDNVTVYDPTNVLHLGVINDGGDAANNFSTTSLTAHQHGQCRRHIDRQW